MARLTPNVPAHSHQSDIIASYRQGRTMGFVAGAATTIGLVIAWTYMWWLVVIAGLGAAGWGFWKVRGAKRGGASSDSASGDRSSG
jgi:hypothetical protein